MHEKKIYSECLTWTKPSTCEAEEEQTRQMNLHHDECEKKSPVLKKKKTKSSPEEESSP